MSSVKTNWILELTDNVSGHLKSIDGNVQKITIDANEMTRSLKETSAVNIQAIVQSFSDVRDKLMQSVQPGIRFQSALAAGRSNNRCNRVMLWTSWAIRHEKP